MGERRQFKRFEVSIPCTVEWSGRTIEGQITWISMGGAMISHVNGVPPPGTPGLLNLILPELRETMPIELEAKVIHSLEEVLEGKGMISAGVQFSGSSEEIETKLLPVFHVLGLEPD